MGRILSKFLLSSGRKPSFFPERTATAEAALSRPVLSVVGAATGSLSAVRNSCVRSRGVDVFWGLLRFSMWRVTGKQLGRRRLRLRTGGHWLRGHRRKWHSRWPMGGRHRGRRQTSRGVRSSPLKKERAPRFGPCWPCLWRGSTCRRPLRRLAESDGKMIAGEERSWGRHPGRGAGVSITEIRSPIRAGLRKRSPAPGGGIRSG